jgi:hypothetical protein
MDDTDLALLRRDIQHWLMRNRFTLVRRTTDSVEDTWGQVDRDEEETEHRVGTYLPKGLTQMAPLGAITVQSPTLLVPHDRPLAKGDRVADIRSLDNATVYVEGPLTVMDVEADAGEATVWRCTLAGASPAPIVA